MHSFTILTTTLCISAVATISHAQVTEKKALILSAAKHVAIAAEAEAKAKNARAVIAVVDDGGHLRVLERLDDTQVASVNVAIGKARTAAIFRRPSREFEEQIRTGRAAALALPEATPLQGGVPITSSKPLQPMERSSERADVFFPRVSDGSICDPGGWHRSANHP